VIREILQSGDGDRRYVLVVEHDLAVLDYLSDFICVLYGAPGAYGVVTCHTRFVWVSTHSWLVSYHPRIYDSGIIPYHLRYQQAATT
jgi:translation initiation factor RLI1